MTQKKGLFQYGRRGQHQKALEKCNRLNCTAHVLATVNRNTFDMHKKQTKSFLFTNAPECYQGILACKRVVVYIKRSGKNLELAKTVKVMVETRWNTLVDMLESVFRMFRKIEELVSQNGEGAKLGGWNSVVAGQLIDFLRPFKNISIELQAKKSPTLHLVLIRRDDLFKHCAIDAEKDPPVSLFSMWVRPYTT